MKRTFKYTKYVLDGIYVGLFTMTSCFLCKFSWFNKYSYCLPFLIECKHLTYKTFKNSSKTSNQVVSIETSALRMFALTIILIRNIYNLWENVTVMTTHLSKFEQIDYGLASIHKP